MKHIRSDYWSAAMLGARFLVSNTQNFHCHSSIYILVAYRKTKEGWMKERQTENKL